METQVKGNGITNEVIVKRIKYFSKNVKIVKFIFKFEKFKWLKKVFTFLF